MECVYECDRSLARAHVIRTEERDDAIVQFYVWHAPFIVERIQFFVGRVVLFCFALDVCAKSTTVAVAILNGIRCVCMCVCALHWYIVVWPGAKIYLLCFLRHFSNGARVFVCLCNYCILLSFVIFLLSVSFDL